MIYIKNIILLSSIFIFIVFNISYADELNIKGKEIFLNQGNCATCHTLSDANSNGSIGPNLNEIFPSKDQVLNAVTKGIGVMPAYEGVLTPEEIEAVASYVSNVSQK